MKMPLIAYHQTHTPLYSVRDACGVRIASDLSKEDANIIVISCNERVIVPKFSTEYMNHKFKLPLVYASHRQVFDADRNVAFEVWSGGMGTEAADEFQEFAVTACNAHGQLVAALQEARSELAWIGRYHAGKASPSMGSTVIKINAALTAAGVQP